MTPLPMQEYLLDCFEQIGPFLIWLVRPHEHFITEQAANRWNSRFPGTVAGSENRSNNYIQIQIDLKMYLGHRIVYKMYTGIDPHVIDHKNRVRWDNRFENLRSGTQTDNMQNIKLHRYNISRHKGITLKRNGWEVQVRHKGKTIYLGVRNTLEEAIALKTEWDNA